MIAKWLKTYLSTGRIHFVVFQICHQKVRRLLKLANEHKESIITEHWLHKERTESTNKQVLPKKQVKGSTCKSGFTKRTSKQHAIATTLLLLLAIQGHEHFLCLHDRYTKCQRLQCVICLVQDLSSKCHSNFLGQRN